MGEGRDERLKSRRTQDGGRKAVFRRNDEVDEIDEPSPKEAPDAGGGPCGRGGLERGAPMILRHLVRGSSALSALSILSTAGKGGCVSPIAAFRRNDEVDEIDEPSPKEAPGAGGGPCGVGRFGVRRTDDPSALGANCERQTANCKRRTANCASRRPPLPPDPRRGYTLRRQPLQPCSHVFLRFAIRFLRFSRKALSPCVSPLALRRFGFSDFRNFP